MHVFSNILGIFAFDEKLDIVEKVSFGYLMEEDEKKKIIGEFAKKYQGFSEPDSKTLCQMLQKLRAEEFTGQFRKLNTELSKSGVRDSVKEDILLIQSIKTIEETDRAINLLAKRLREWYEMHNPEFSRKVYDNEKFVSMILENEKKELLAKIGIDEKESLGADLTQENLEPIRNLGQQIFDLFQLKKAQQDYISAIMDKICPNTKAVCDVMIAAKLIEHAGSLKRLSEMPSSTVQVLGAEAALFRHMRTGAKPPRHGLIVGHALFANASQKMHGKIARALADKISIAAKVDFFNGNFIGNQLRSQLEAKFK